MYIRCNSGSNLVYVAREACEWRRGSYREMVGNLAKMVDNLVLFENIDYCH